MFILIKWPRWLLSVVWKSGSYKRAGWQVRAAIRNKANRRMEMAKMLMLCVCLTSVFLHCAEVRVVPFIFWYRHERLHEVFFFRFQSKSNQTDRTFKYITRHRQIQENARFNFMYWAVWNWEIENIYTICVFNEENIGKNVFRDQIYWSFMSNLKWQAADSSFTHSMSSQQSDAHLFNHMQSWWMASLRRNILTALHIVVINYYRVT